MSPSRGRGLDATTEPGNEKTRQVAACRVGFVPCLAAPLAVSLTGQTSRTATPSRVHGWYRQLTRGAIVPPRPLVNPR